MKKQILILLLILACSGNIFSQDKDKNKIISLSGYTSTMQTVMFDSLSGPFTNENLIHNRLNFKGYVNSHIKFAVEFRNRLFTGDRVRTDPAYAGMISFDPGLMDLSLNVLHQPSFFLNSTIDRIWVDLNYGKIEVKAGRQRINWSQTLVWNPNDIFNVYSFFDFDYVERPGSDAIRLQFYPNFSSAFELAVKADYKNDITAAALYRFNKWGYDIQFLSGYYNSEDIVAGTGWSGSIGSVSFRGEASWFQPARHFSDSTGTGIFTIGLDKIFKNSSTAQFQVMYCNKPVSLTGFNALYSDNLSTKDLAYSKISAFGLFSYQVTPLFSLSISAMWFPDLKGYFAGPSLDCSLAENVDFSVYWQHFKSNLILENASINLGFLRVKYSF